MQMPMSAPLIYVTLSTIKYIVGNNISRMQDAMKYSYLTSRKV